MGPALVFFDVGGTLLTAPSFAELLQGLLVDLGVSVDPSELQEAIGVWRHRLEGEPSAPSGSPSREADRQWWRRAAEGVLSACGLASSTVRMGGARFLDRNASMETHRAYDDALPCLTALSRKGQAMGILSNWSWDLNERLEELGWSRFFEPVVISSHVGWRKPHPEIFREARRLASHGSDALLLVGDRIDADVVAAQKAGWDAILIDRGQVDAIRFRHDGGALRPYPSLARLDLLPELLFP